MKGGFASKNNIEVYDSPDLKMRSKQSYRSRSELRRNEYHLNKKDCDQNAVRESDQSAVKELNLNAVNELNLNAVNR